MSSAVLDRSPSGDSAARVSPPRQKSATFRPDVEGLRAVAVALVVLYHAGLSWLPGGYIGVDVFFVVSGFVITGLLTREYAVDGRISIPDFYARRARRILPAATLVLVATLGASNLLLSILRIGPIGRDGLWTAFFSANFRFMSSATNYFNATAPPSPLQHFWSLAVEEQFYLAWPLLLWLLMRAFGRRQAARLSAPRNWGPALATGTLVAASFAWCVHLTNQNASNAYFSPFSRAWELGAGALVCLCAPWIAKIPRSVAVVIGWCGLGAIVFGAVHFDSFTKFPGSAAAVPVLGTAAALVGGYATSRAGVRTFLGIAPLRRVGGWSYSIYLWHWPILVIAVAKYPWLSFLDKMGLVVCSVILSAITYRLLENPIRRSPALTRSSARSISFGLVLILLGAGIANSFVHYSNDTTAAAVAKVALQASEQGINDTATSAEIVAKVTSALGVQKLPVDINPPVALAGTDETTANATKCLIPYNATVSPACTFGDLTSAKTVVLFGDSHAAQWMPALQASTARAKFKLVVLTKVQCPANANSVYPSADERKYTECDDWRQWAMKQIAAMHPTLVVASGTTHGVRFQTSHQDQVAFDAQWDSGMSNMLTQLKGMATSVAWVSDVAYHAQSVPDCLASNETDIQNCTDPLATAIQIQQRETARATSTRVGASFVDTTPWMCTASACPSAIADTVTEFDNSHLTAAYSRYLGHALGVALGLEH